MDETASQLLNNVRVASPCTENWNDMHGSDRVRSCERCQKTVYNLSEMTAREAAEFVRRAQSAEGRVCVRFYRRADDTVITRDRTGGAQAAQSAQATQATRWSLTRRVGMIGLTMASAASIAHANPPQAMSKTTLKPHATHRAQAIRSSAASAAAANHKTRAALSASPRHRKPLSPLTSEPTAHTAGVMTANAGETVSYVSMGELPTLPVPNVELHGSASATQPGIPATGDKPSATPIEKDNAPL